MAKAAKKIEENPVNTTEVLFEQIVTATQAGGHMYASMIDLQPLIEQNAVEINQDDKDAEGNVAVRAVAGAQTASGQSASVAQVAAAGGASEAAPKPSFSVSTGFDLDAFKEKRTRTGGGGGRTAKYPFETLEVGFGFFVADADVKNKDAFATMVSSISSAEARFAEKTGNVVTKKLARKDAEGKAVKGEDGKRIMEDTQVEETLKTREFGLVKIIKGKDYSASNVAGLGSEAGAWVQRKA